MIRYADDSNPGTPQEKSDVPIPKLYSDSEKIFGIGLSRTGTASLNTAFKLLGMRSCHNPQQLFRDPIAPVLGANDAFFDLPIPLLYRRYFDLFPQSKFILTTRPLDDWIASMRWLFNDGKRVWSWDRQPINHEIHASLYGTTEFNEEILRRAFAIHHEQVSAFFRLAPERLLVCDISQGVGWEPICEFLDMAEPKIDFPQTNAKSSRSKRWLRTVVKQLT